MTFRIALSGLNAATADLNVTANNIANVNTPGFKRSRAEFSDLFAVSPYGLAKNEIGAGVKVSGISQQFAQGNIDFTDNSLDMAISGEGFFTLSRNGAHVYSRAGNFSVDRNGYVVNNTGDRLQAFPAVPGLPGAAPTFNTGALGDLHLSVADAPPSATQNATVGTNLPANATAPTVTPFSATNAQSYNQSTSMSFYDSLGVEHTATFYYVKTANPNEWQMYSTVDGTAVGGANTLQYDTSGALIAPAGGTLALPAYAPTNGAAPMPGGAHRLRQPTRPAAARRHHLGRNLRLRPALARRRRHVGVRKGAVRRAGGVQRRPDRATGQHDHRAARLPGERADDFDGRPGHPDHHQHPLTPATPQRKGIPSWTKAFMSR